MLLDPISMQYIAKETGVTRQTVINILDEMPDAQRLKLPSVLCIDEFHFSNANTKAGKYPSVISNPFKSDMNETYRYVHDAFFYNSIHIVDHFHVVKLFTEAVQNVRVRIMKNQDKNTYAYKFLKKNWKLFLMNKYDLEKLTYVNNRTGVVHNYADKVDLVLKNYPELAEVYYAKDLFCYKTLKLKDYDETKKTIDFFINNFSKSTCVELTNIANTFSNWYEEIINAYSKNSFGVVLTNAIAESNNNYIQKLINISYGYTNFNRLRKRILYISSNRKRVSD